MEGSIQSVGILNSHMAILCSDLVAMRQSADGFFNSVIWSTAPASGIGANVDTLQQHALSHAMRGELEKLGLAKEPAPPHDLRRTAASQMAIQLSYGCAITGGKPPAGALSNTAFLPALNGLFTAKEVFAER
jgi:hypothetical protein